MNATQRWAGRLVSALVVAFLLADAATSLFTPGNLAAQVAETAFPEAMLRPVGIIALVAAITYALPATALLGAILVTGFLGGAIATHLRLEQMTAPPQLICCAVGVLAWAGLWLRDPRLRALLPLRPFRARL